MQVFNINDAYFKYMKCLSGITYQFVNQLSDIYQMNLMVGTNYCIYCMYNEFDIINNFMNNLYQVDVCSTKNIDITQKYYKIDDVPLKTKHRVILVGQTDTKENNVYNVDSRGYLTVSDDLRSGNTWRYKAYVKLGNNKGKQFHLKNVGNRFPIGYPSSENENKEFLDGHGYIIKNYFNYNLFQTVDNIVPKLIFTDYELARISVDLDENSYPLNLWEGFEFPIIYSGGKIEIIYHNSDIETINVVENQENLYYYDNYIIGTSPNIFSNLSEPLLSGSTMNIINIDINSEEISQLLSSENYGPETWVTVNNDIYTGTTEGDYIRIVFRGTTTMSYNTFVKRKCSYSGNTYLVLKDYIPDDVLNGCVSTDTYNFRNLTYATEYNETERYWNIYSPSSYFYSGLTNGSFVNFGGITHVTTSYDFYSGAAIGDSIKISMSGNTSTELYTKIKGFNTSSLFVDLNATYNSGSTEPPLQTGITYTVLSGYIVILDNGDLVGYYGVGSTYTYSHTTLLPSGFTETFNCRLGYNVLGITGSTVLILLDDSISDSTIKNLSGTTYNLNNLEYVAKDDIYTVASESYFNQYFQIDIIDDKRYIKPKRYDLNRYFDYDGLQFIFNSNSVRVHGLVKGSFYNVLTGLSGTTNLPLSKIQYSGTSMNGIFYADSNGQFDFFIKGGIYDLIFSEADNPDPNIKSYMPYTINSATITGDTLFIVTLEHYLSNITGEVTDLIIDSNISQPYYSGITSILNLENESKITANTMIGNITGYTVSDTYTLTDLLSGSIYMVCENLGYDLNNGYPNYEIQQKTIYTLTGTSIQNFSLYPTSNYKKGKIHGIVTDVNNGNPLSGVTIYAQIGNITSYSNSGGTYNMDNLYLINEFSQYHPYASHNIQFSKYGFQTLLSGLTIIYRLDQLVNIGLDYQKVNVCGIVTDKDTGEVVSGATIIITGTTFLLSGFTGITTTDSNGNYCFSNIIFGSYHINYSRTDYMSGETLTFSINSPNQFDENISIEHEKGTIFGTVTKIYYYEDKFFDLNSHSYIILPEGGYYTYDSLTYEAWIAVYPGGFPIFTEITSPRLGYEDPTYSITGYPVQGAVVTVTDGIYIRQATTDTGGTYTLDGIRTGTRVGVSSRSANDKKYTTQTKSFIATTGSTNVDFLLDFAYNISGTVYIENGSNLSSEKLVLQSSSLSLTGYSQTNGSYSFSDSRISGGTYNMIYTHSESCNLSGTTTFILSGGTDRILNIPVKKNVPDAAGVITLGPNNNICNKINNYYEIQTIPKATSYNWVSPYGTTIVGQGTQTITVICNQTVINGLITVAGINSCGSGPSSSTNITVYVPIITGPTSVVAGLTSADSYLYSAQSSYPVSAINWYVTGGTILSNPHQWEADILWNDVGSGNIIVDFVFGSCVSSDQKTITIDHPNTIFIPYIEMTTNNLDFVTLSWSATYRYGIQSDSYQIWHKLDSGSWGILGTTSNLTVTYSGNFGSVGETNHYKIKAIQGTNYSDYSNEVYFTVQSTPPGIPTLYLNTDSTTYINLSWSTLSGNLPIAGYEVWHQFNSDDWYLETTVVSSSYITNNVGNVGDINRYKVIAFDSSSNYSLAFSDIKSEQTTDIVSNLISIDIGSKNTRLICAVDLSMNSNYSMSPITVNYTIQNTTNNSPTKTFQIASSPGSIVHSSNISIYMDQSNYPGDTFSLTSEVSGYDKLVVINPPQTLPYNNNA